MVPVALVTATDGVCHLKSAAVIISRQRRRSIYPDRGRADREQTNENNNRDREIGPLFFFHSTAQLQYVEDSEPVTRST